MDDRHARCIGPDSFMISFFLVLSVCIRTHCIRYSIVHLVSFVRYHVRVCWHGVLKFPKGRQTESVQKQPSQIDWRDREGVERPLEFVASRRKSVKYHKRRGLDISYGYCVYEIMYLSLLSI